MREGFFEQVSDALRGGPVFLRRRDIRRPEALVRRLAESGDPVSRNLFERLPNTAREALDSFEGSNGMSGDQLRIIVEGLNALIKGESLYDEERFAGISLRPETRKLTQSRSLVLSQAPRTRCGCCRRSAARPQPMALPCQMSGRRPGWAEPGRE